MLMQITLRRTKYLTTKTLAQMLRAAPPREKCTYTRIRFGKSISLRYFCSFLLNAHFWSTDICGKTKYTFCLYDHMGGGKNRHLALVWRISKKKKCFFFVYNGVVAVRLQNLRPVGANIFAHTHFKCTHSRTRKMLRKFKLSIFIIYILFNLAQALFYFGWSNAKA